jgi:hypothetical protein
MVIPNELNTSQSCHALICDAQFVPSESAWFCKEMLHTQRVMFATISTTYIWNSDRRSEWYIRLWTVDDGSAQGSFLGHSLFLLDICVDHWTWNRTDNR